MAVKCPKYQEDNPDIQKLCSVNRDALIREDAA